MSVTVNILHFKVNNMTNNASIVIGNGYHNSHSSETQSHGNVTTIGDEATANPTLKNFLKDTSLIDQSEMGNSDNMFVDNSCDEKEPIA